MIIQYVLNKWPYRLAYMNRLELANESAILSLTYILWTMSDYQGNVTMKIKLGWLYCLVIMVCLAINFSVMIYFAVWISCKNKCYKMKLKKEKKKAMQFLQVWSSKSAEANSQGRKAN